MHAALTYRAVLAVAVAASACLFLPSSSVSAAEASRVKNGLIAFVSVRDHGSFELFTMRPNGTRQRRITVNGPRAEYPSWSPDGSQLAIIVESHTRELWISRADGTKRRRIAGGAAPFGAAARHGAAWSPDGRTLAFARRRGIWLVGGDGARLRRLTTGSDDSSPTWSPDGTRVAFARDAGASVMDLYSADVASGRVTRLTATLDISEEAPDWSSSGIVYARTTAGEQDDDIWVMSGDGSDHRNITNSQFVEEADPTWSPDGREVAFVSNDDDAPLGIVSVDGGATRGLASASGAEAPDWSPDGSRIAFSTFGSVSTVSRDGGPPVRLITGRDDSAPAWSRDGKRLAFSRGGIVYEARADGSGLRRIAEGDDPSWSPNGTRLLVANGDLTAIDIVTANGRYRRNLLFDDGAGDPSVGDPAWSPAGSEFAYVEFTDTSSVCVFRLRRGRIGCPAVGEAPAWSPDGRRIVYECGQGVCVEDLRGRADRRLARRGSEPAFSPDGRRIVYTVESGLVSDLYVMNADGTKKRRLTRHPGPDFHADWQPVR